MAMSRPATHLHNIPGASALAGIAAQAAPVPHGSGGAVHLRDDGLLDKINLRCAAGNTILRRNLVKAVGVDLPRRPNTFTHAGGRQIARLGPDEWLILTESGAGETIIAAIDTPDSGHPDAGHIAATDVSDALGSLTVSGIHTRDMLAKHCALDFHPSVFTPMMAPTTLLSHAGVTIMCLEENAFRIIGRTSFMPYIANLLMDAAIEYGYEYSPAN